MVKEAHFTVSRLWNGAQDEVENGEVFITLTGRFYSPQL